MLDICVCLTCRSGVDTLCRGIFTGLVHRPESRLICPFCSANDDRVIDSRSSERGKAIRRRRICNHCGKRFTTYERVESVIRLMVVKRDGARQPFDTEKILSGIAAACGKLPIPSERKLLLIEELEEELYRDYEREVPSTIIGEKVAQRLRDLNPIAYVRFVSVYKEFQALDQLIDEAQDTRAATHDKVPGQRNLFNDGT